MAHHAAAEADGDAVRRGHHGPWLCRRRRRQLQRSLRPGSCGIAGKSARVGDYYPSPQVLLEASHAAAAAWVCAAAAAASTAVACTWLLLVLVPVLLSLDVVKHPEEDVAPRGALQQVREAEESEINQAGDRRRRHPRRLLLPLPLRRRPRAAAAAAAGTRRVRQGEKPRHEAHQRVDGRVDETRGHAGRERSRRRCSCPCRPRPCVGDLQCGQFPEPPPEGIQGPGCRLLLCCSVLQLVAVQAFILPARLLRLALRCGFGGGAI